MRRSRFSEDEILFFMAEADNGIAVEAICSSAGISERTFYRWRQRYGGLTAQAVHRLRRLEEENRGLRRQLAKSLSEVVRPASLYEAPRLRSDCGALRTDGPQVRPGRAVRGAIVGRFAALRTGR